MKKKKKAIIGELKGRRLQKEAIKEETPKRKMLKKKSRVQSLLQLHQVERIRMKNVMTIPIENSQFLTLNQFNLKI